MNEYVNIDGLKSISNILLERSKEIEKLYNKSLLPILSSSEEYFNSSTAFNDEIIEYNQIYKEAMKKLYDLSNILNDYIIKDYTNMKYSVSEIFRKNLNNSLFSTINYRKEK